eukprot:70443-Prorocentrum_minimum.AAC.6
MNAIRRPVSLVTALETRLWLLTAADACAAGPKMRKWYGQGERGAEDEYGYDDADFDDDEEEDTRPAVLVTDAETEMGQIGDTETMSPKTWVTLNIRATFFNPFPSYPCIAHCITKSHASADTPLRCKHGGMA